MKIRIKIKPQDITAIDEFQKNKEKTSEANIEVLSQLLERVTQKAFIQKQKLQQELSELL